MYIEQPPDHISESLETIEGFDQSHLYPDMSRPGIEPRPPAWEASILEKNHTHSLLLITYSELLSSTYEPVNAPTKPFFGLTYFDSLMQIREKFGSWMEKTQIPDKHPRSATLDLTGTTY